MQVRFLNAVHFRSHGLALRLLQKAVKLSTWSRRLRSAWRSSDVTAAWSKWAGQAGHLRASSGSHDPLSHCRDAHKGVALGVIFHQFC